MGEITGAARQGGATPTLGQKKGSLGSLAKAALASETTAVNHLVMRISRIDTGAETVEGVLLLRSGGLVAGTKVKVRWPEDSPGRPCARLIGAGQPADANGRGGIPASGPGDILHLMTAGNDPERLLAREFCLRSHAGMEGGVVTTTGLLAINPPKCSQRGISQMATVADPSAAKVVRNEAELAAFLGERQAGNGQRIGFAMRAKGVVPGKEPVHFQMWGDPPETIADFAARAWAAVGRGFEAVPMLRTAVGSWQARRDVRMGADGKPEAANGFTRRFDNRFLPCVIVWAEEEEKAFGQPTGNIRLVAAAIEPLTQNPLSLAGAASPLYRPEGTKQYPVLTLDRRETAAPAAIASTTGGTATEGQRGASATARRPSGPPVPSQPQGQMRMAPPAPRPLVAPPRQPALVRPPGIPKGQADQKPDDAGAPSPRG
jgi:hypothetical protein